jgi:hypothetical protein
MNGADSGIVDRPGDVIGQIIEATGQLEHERRGQPLRLRAPLRNTPATNNSTAQYKFDPEGDSSSRNLISARSLLQRFFNLSRIAAPDAISS